jgi:hypothetical protein
VYVRPLPGIGSALDATPEQRQHYIHCPAELLMLETLQHDFECIGTSSEELFKYNLQAILGSINPESPIFLTLLPEVYDVDRKPAHNIIKLNRWLRDVASLLINLHLVALADFVETPAELRPDGHVTRLGITASLITLVALCKRPLARTRRIFCCAAKIDGRVAEARFAPTSAAFGHV